MKSHKTDFFLRGREVLGKRLDKGKNGAGGLQGFTPERVENCEGVHVSFACGIKKGGETS